MRFNFPEKFTETSVFQNEIGNLNGLGHVYPAESHLPFWNPLPGFPFFRLIKPTPHSKQRLTQTHPFQNLWSLQRVPLSHLGIRMPYTLSVTQTTDLYRSLRQRPECGLLEQMRKSPGFCKPTKLSTVLCRFSTRRALTAGFQAARGRETGFVFCLSLGRCALCVGRMEAVRDR